MSSKSLCVLSSSVLSDRVSMQLEGYLYVFSKYHLTVSYLISVHHIISYYIMSYYIILYHVTLNYIISHYIMSYYIMSYNIISYDIILYHVTLYYIMSCRISLYPIFPITILSSLIESNPIT